MADQPLKTTPRKRIVYSLICLISAPFLIPLLLALVDTGTSIVIGHPVFSKFEARYWDGGSELYAGWGYHLFLANKLSGERGPVIWTWSVPIELSLTNRKRGLYPLGA
jgi:hypothetical protein